MLTAFRERITGVIGWIILGVLFVAFSLFGLESYLQSTVTNYAAAVNDQEISLGRHQQAYQQLRTRMTEMLGEGADPSMLNEDILKANALERLINEEVLIQAANEAGFRGSNQQVGAYLNSIDAFKQDGRFSKEQYERVLGYQGRNPAEFEHSVKLEIVADQYRNGVSATSAATQSGLESAFMLEGQQRQFTYVVIPKADHIEQATVSEADIEEYFAANRTSFMTPERVRLEYIELNAATLDPGVEVADAAIQALYDEQSAKYVTPEERKARHILVQLLPDAEAATVEAAEGKVDAIVARLDAGEDFAAVARDTSDDPGSASSGGDLGFFARGMMTPAFDQAVFELPVGKRSDPVRSDFGFHIIEVLEIKPEVAVPLAEVRDELVDQLLTQERNDQFYEQSETLASISFEQPDSLQGAADATGLAIQQTDWIERNSSGEGIAGNSGVVESAFSEDVLLNGNNSAPIELSPDHMVVIRVLDHEQAAEQPLEAVRGIVEERLVDIRASEEAEAVGTALLDRLTATGSRLSELASADGLESVTTPMVTRNVSEPPREILNTAFAIRAPAEGAVTSEGRRLANGDYLVVSLEKTAAGSLDKLPPQAQTQTRRALSRVQGEAELAAVLSTLREQAVVVIPESEDF